MGFTVKAVVAPEAEIDEVLAKLYGKGDASMMDVMAQLSDSDALSALQGRGDSVDLEDLVSATEDNKVVRLLNLVLLQAIKRRLLLWRTFLDVGRPGGLRFVFLCRFCGCVWRLLCSIHIAKEARYRRPSAARTRM